MATGDVTATFVGRSNMSGGAIAALMTGQNLGAATVATSTANFEFVYSANGMEVLIFKVARAA